MCKALKRPPWLWSFSIAQHVRHLNVHPLWGLYWSTAGDCVWGERGYSDGSTLCIWLSIISLPPWPLLPSKSISHQDLLHHIPSGSLPVVSIRPCPGIAVQTLHSSSQPLHVLGDLRPCPGYIGLWQSLSVWFSFHSDCHRSAAAFSCSLHCPNILPCCEDLTDASVPLCSGCRLSLYHSPLSFVLPSFASVYTFLFSGQGLLPTFNWCSERTSATEDVFLMHHPWRQMYSTPTYSSNTLPMAVYCWIWLANILLKTFASKFIKTITFIFLCAILVCFSMKTVLAS